MREPVGPQPACGRVHSGRQMGELLQIAEQNSSRIVFSGDTQQIQSVEACDALRVLEKESRLKSVSLREVKRQTAADYRDAIQELRRNPGRGFERLDEIGAVRELPFMQRPQAIVQAYLDSAVKGQSALVVCATHDEIGRLNCIIGVFKISVQNLQRIVKSKCYK